MPLLQELRSWMNKICEPEVPISMSVIATTLLGWVVVFYICSVIFVFFFFFSPTFPHKELLLLNRSLQSQRAWTSSWWCGHLQRKSLLCRNTWWRELHPKGWCATPLGWLWSPPTDCLLWFQVLNIHLPSQGLLSSRFFKETSGRTQSHALSYSCVEKGGTDDLEHVSAPLQLHRRFHWRTKTLRIYGKLPCLGQCRTWWVNNELQQAWLRAK